MATYTRQQLEQLMGPGWTIVGERTETEEKETRDQYGEVTGKTQQPTGRKVFVVRGPNGEPDEIVVRPKTTPGEETVYDLEVGPKNKPATAAGAAKPAKGQKIIELEGGQWVQKTIVDDAGTKSVDVDANGKPIAVPVEKPTTASGAPTTKTVNGRTFQYDPGTNTWPEAQGLPTEAAKPEARKTTTYGTGPNDRFTFTIDTETGEVISRRENENYVKPKSPTEELTPGQAAVDTATAATASGVAEANLRRAQADADSAAQNLANAQRQARQAPTDQQAQQAIQQALTQSQLANKQLEQAIAQVGTLNPIAVQQAQATLARTKQQVQQETLGTDLYGMRDRIKEIKDLLRSGEIDEQSADMMLGAVQRGTTVSQALTSLSGERTARRSQDLSSRNQMASTFGSMATSGFNTLAGMNQYAQPGSTAGADAFVAMMNMAQDRLKAYELPPAPETDFLGTGSRVGGLANVAAQQVAQAPQPQGAAPNSAQPITINIGSGAASNPQPPMPAPAPQFGASPTAGAGQAMDDPYGRTNALVSTAAKQTPATVADVFKAFGVA